MRDPIRILIVDDHDATRSALASAMQDEADFKVVGQARDATDAITKVQRLHPNVILMDVRMPRVDGVDATRLIRGTWPTSQVIGLSVDDSDRQRMKDAGAFDLLKKDGGLPQLFETIRQAARLNTWTAEG